ncbi:MAG: hypothetical protein ACXWXO_16980 [Nocardioides sp.]
MHEARFRDYIRRFNEDGVPFEFDGVIMYRLDEADRFADILVAYNSFVHTDHAGVRTDLGIPH